MEFLIYTLCGIAAFFVLFRPKQEKLAFYILASSFAIAAVVFLIAIAGSFIPAVTL